MLRSENKDSRFLQSRQPQQSEFTALSSKEGKPKAFNNESRGKKNLKNELYDEKAKERSSKATSSTDTTSKPNTSRKPDRQIYCPPRMAKNNQKRRTSISPTDGAGDANVSQTDSHQDRFRSEDKTQTGNLTSEASSLLLQKPVAFGNQPQTSINTNLPSAVIPSPLISTPSGIYPGAQCSARYWEDGIMYPAVVNDVHQSKPFAVVQFTGYGNCEEVHFSDINVQPSAPTSAPVVTYDMNTPPPPLPTVIDTSVPPPNFHYSFPANVEYRNSSSTSYSY